ncbi:MAG: hypothetical protein HDS10_03685 [Bacteroides sp.]|nr:hypothetical protein [Bacteroides sp.]
MLKLSVLLPETVSIEEMMSVKGGISDLDINTEAEDKLTIECKPGPAVSCYPGSAV